MKNYLLTLALTGALLMPLSSWACDAAGPSTHIGNLMSVDATGKTFTIRDAQSNSPISFSVKDDSIMAGLKNAKGSIMVNYEENDSGLTAVGVTF